MALECLNVRGEEAGGEEGARRTGDVEEGEGQLRAVYELDGCEGDWSIGG